MDALEKNLSLHLVISTGYNCFPKAIYINLYSHNQHREKSLLCSFIITENFYFLPLTLYKLKMSPLIWHPFEY